MGSTPASQRNQPDTEARKKFETLKLCAELVKHGEQCFLSKKVQGMPFTMMYILIESEDIFLCVHRANRIPFTKGKITEENWKAREALQLEAMRLCSDLEGLIVQAQYNYKWRKRKVYYYTNLVLKTREYIVKWYSANRAEYDKMLAG